MGTISDVRITPGTGGLYQVTSSSNGSLVSSSSNGNSSLASPTILNDGKGVGIFEGMNNSGAYLFKSIIAGDGIVLTTTNADITISSNASSKWLTGTSAPASSLGNIGDFYLNSATGDVFTKTVTSWVYITTFALAISDFNSAVSLGTGIPVLSSFTNGTLSIKSVSAGANVAVTDNGYGLITISVPSLVSSIILTGDVTGSGSGTVPTVLSPSGVTAGTYTKMTVNAKGLVTTGGLLNSGDITSALGYTPVNTAAVGSPNGVAMLDSSGKILMSEMPAALVGAVIYQGIWDASLNAPHLVSGVGTKGWYYEISNAGNTVIDGNGPWVPGDIIIFNGTTWDKISGGGVIAPVSSVNGMTGNVTIVNIIGNAGTSTKWTSATTIDYTGDVTGSSTFDGSATPVATLLTLASTGFPAGSYNTVTVNAKGLVTSGTYISYLTSNNAPVLSVNGYTGNVSLKTTDLLDWASATSKFLTTAPVLSVSSRTGAITLTHVDLTDWASATANFLTTAPVLSVANKTGNITLTHIDLTDWASATANFLTTAPVLSVSGRTGSIVLTYTDVSGLATVAHSGSYTDLTNQPIIPSITGLVQKSGDTMSGSLKIAGTLLPTYTQFMGGYSEMAVPVSISGGVLTIPVNQGSVFDFNLTANITSLVFSSPATSGYSSSVILTSTGTGGAYTWTGLTNVKWAGGNVPVLTTTAGKTDIFSFFTYNGGTTWYGIVVGQNF